MQHARTGPGEFLFRSEAHPENVWCATATAASARPPLAGARVQNTVEDFKKFIENRGQETGAWRGEVHGGQQTS